MKILILTEFFKSHKNDILVFNYVESLKNQGHKVKVICCATSIISYDVFQLSMHFNLDYKKFILNRWYSFFYKVILILFRRSFTKYLFKDTFSSLNKRIIKEKFKPDLVLQFAGGAYEAFLFDLSKKFSIKYQVPYFLHSFDPIPNTAEWGEKPAIRNATIQLLTPFITSAHRFSAVSPRMTAYFKDTYGLAPENMYTLYMPIKYHKIDQKNTDRISFLYLGNIYGMRDPKPMFAAFNQLMGESPRIELVLAGTKLNKEDLIASYPNFKKGLKFIEWTDQPNELIKNCSVLIDLNADISGDVFISSKLMRYLGFNKPILVIGNENSASFDFSSKFSGIHFSKNNKEEIFKTVNHIIHNKKIRQDKESEIRAYEVSKLVSSLINIS
jgi:glycosyltransferase involved in cell wall biosynthesis